MIDKDDNEELIIIDGKVITKKAMSNIIKDELKKIQKEIKGRHYVRDEAAIEAFNEIVEMVTVYFKDSGYSIDTKVFYPTLSMGSITITGRNINFKSDMLYRIMDIAESMEIAPFSDGKVSIIFGFEGLMVLE